LKILNSQFSILNCVAAAALLVVLTSPATADTVWVSSGGANALEIGRVKIIGVEDAAGGKPEERVLVFQSAGGSESRRPLATVTRVEVDDDPSLNAAEEAYAGGKWDVATDNYLKSLRGATKDWLKSWASRRLIESAEKSGRFDAAVAGYIARVMLNPAEAGPKPAMPDEKSAFLQQGAKEIQTALANPKLTPHQRQALLSFQLDLHRARKDQRAAAETLEQMLKSGAIDASDPAAAASLARLKLDVAAVALDSKQYQKAIDEVQANKHLFTDERAQADALLVLAEARYGLAQQKNNDPVALKDAGLAYMRVVAHFKDHPDRPHVAAALLRTAEIHEKLNQTDAALALYQQVATQFNDDPAAGPKAKASAERLKGS
jgi:TolA-binding protein